MLATSKPEIFAKKILERFDIAKYFDKIYYVGSNGIERKLIKNTKIKYYTIDCAKLYRKITLKNLKIPFVLLKSIKQSKKIINETKPDVIFSKGGYVAVPTVIAGYKKGIPVISHESDLTVGLANKITSKYCKTVLTSFKETCKQIPNGKYVGPPLRQELFTAKKNYNNFGFDNSKPVLLVTGGSQGAQSINIHLRKIIPELIKTFNVLHLCGKDNIDNNFHIKEYCQLEYLTEIEKAYAIADVCVTRAGSNTLFELLALNIPCLVIPLPKGISRGDQVLNANYFYNKKLVNLLEQDNLSSNSLLKSITDTYSKRQYYINNLNKFNVKNSCEDIAKILINSVKD